MRSPNKRKPAPALTGNGPSKDRRGGSIGFPHNTPESAAQYDAVARRRWPHGIVLPPELSDGPYAVVSYCDATIVSIHPTWERAEACLLDLDEIGCAKRDSTRRCRFRRKNGIQAWRHQIVDLREPPIMRIGDCDIWPEPNEMQQVAR